MERSRALRKIREIGKGASACARNIIIMRDNNRRLPSIPQRRLSSSPSYRLDFAPKILTSMNDCFFALPATYLGQKASKSGISFNVITLLLLLHTYFVITYYYYYRN